MTHPLLELVGRSVTSADPVHDYVQLSFGHDIGLSIYNSFRIVPEAVPFGGLVARKVLAIDIEADNITLTFDGAVTLRIDMRAAAYRGPEALQLDRAGQPTVIWD